MLCCTLLSISADSVVLKGDFHLMKCAVSPSSHFVYNLQRVWHICHHSLCCVCYPSGFSSNDAQHREHTMDAWGVSHTMIQAAGSHWCAYMFRVDLVRKQLYVLLSNGHIHIWRMHNQKPPTLVAVWDKLTPNQRDHALCMSFMRGAALDPALAEMQGMLRLVAVLFSSSHSVHCYLCLCLPFSPCGFAGHMLHTLAGTIRLPPRHSLFFLLCPCLHFWRVSFQTSPHITCF